MSNENDRKKDFDQACKDGWAGWGSWQTRARLDFKAFLGDPLTSKEKQRLIKAQREPLSFPLMRRIINWVSGFHRDNMKSIRYDPVEGSDDQTASQLTAAGLWVLQHSNAYNVIADGFENALITGMNLINVYNDRNFNTSYDRFGYNQFLLDPTFSRIDLKDCSFGIMRKYITSGDAKMLFPGKESFVDELEKKEQQGEQSKTFSFFPRPHMFGKKLIAADEFQVRDTKEVHVILIKPINREIIWRGGKKAMDRQIELLVAQGIPAELITTFPRWEPTIEVTTYLDGHEVGNAIDPYGIGDYSFTPVLAYYAPDFAHQHSSTQTNLRLQGLVRGLVDSQRAADKRTMAMSAIFEQQAGVGVDFEEDTFFDEEDAFNTNSGAPRKFKKGALSNNKVRDRQPGGIDASQFQLHKLFEDIMPKMVNVNEEMFGFSSDNKVQIAGVLAKLRTGAGLIGLRNLFHNLELTYKLIGAKQLKLIQQYPPDRIQRMINQQPSQSFYKRDFGKFDTAVVEGMLTDTQRNLFYSELLNLKRLGAEVNDPAPIPWSLIIKNAPIQMKDELLKTMQAIEQQNQQAQQKQAQDQQVLQQLAIQSTMAQAAEDQAQGVERRAQAAENITSSALNRAKVIAEIAKIGGEPFVKLLQLAVQLEKTNNQGVGNMR